MLVNSPHNPTGAVLTREQLEHIGELAAELDAVIVTDEVYEHLDASAASSTSRWRPCPARRAHGDDLVGGQDVLGDRLEGRLGPRPGALVNAVLAVKQFLTYVSGAPFQPAIATASGCPTPSSPTCAGGCARKRDLLAEGLRAAGFTRLPARGTYFIVTDAAPLGFDDGAAFCRRLPELAGVVAVPVSVFCADPRRRADARAVRVLQARRGARRGGVAARRDADLRLVSVLTAFGHGPG